jgi:hypothetical protein
MSDWQKIAIGIAAALLFGVVFGFFWGRSGKGELEKAAEAAEQRAAAAKQEADDAKSELEGVKNKNTRLVELLRAKEKLFRCIRQLDAKNFGLASQRIAAAGQHLRRAKTASSASVAKMIAKVAKELTEAHAMAQGLDSLVRVRVERLINDINAIPGAR